LRADGSTYSLERALLLMYNKDEDLDNFKGTILEKCTESSQKELLKKIKCTAVVHDIRDILAQQCFIGIVGIQDSGKLCIALYI